MFWFLDVFKGFSNTALEQNWVKMKFFYYFWYRWFIFCQNMVHFLRNLLILTWKLFLTKIENLVAATFYLWNNLLTLLWNFKGLLIITKWTHIYESINLYFLIGCYGNCKNPIFLVTMTTITRGDKFLFIYAESEY